MQVTGSVIHLTGLQVKGNDFKISSVVVKTKHEQYPQEIKVDFVQANTDKLNGVNIGDDVTIDINLRGNSYGGKWYVTLQGWKINVDNKANF